MAKNFVDSTLIESHYNIFKNKAQQCIDKKQLTDALKYIEIAARLAYKYNFLKNFSDDDLENCLTRISNEIPNNSIQFKGIEERVVFCDYFALPNRGLTQQYISALIKLNYQILFIATNNKSFDSTNSIYNELVKYGNAEIVDLHKVTDEFEKVTEIIRLITAFKPSKAFLHLSPWDVTGILSFIPLGNSLCRYFINITDHAFWLGRNIIDKCIEFRNYGYQLSKVCRKIPEHKLLMLQYYPILQNDHRFMGIPNELKDKIIGVSGGSGYKFLDKRGKFYDLISTLLKRHSCFSFLLIGVEGPAKSYFKQRIKSDNLDGRFILLPNRPDLFQIFKKCHIYFTSFPVGGGLIMQVAAMAQLPIVFFNDIEYHFNDISDLLPKRTAELPVFYGEKEFYDVSTKIIEDAEFRHAYAGITANSVRTKEEFELQLSHILGGIDDFEYHSLKPLANIESSSDVLSSVFLDVKHVSKSEYYLFLSKRLSSHQVDLLDRELKTTIKKEMLKQKLLKSQLFGLPYRAIRFLQKSWIKRG